MRRPAVLALLLLAYAATLSCAGAEVVATGRVVPDLAPFDRAMAQLLDRWEYPGGALAVARDGRLVYARGFGFADKDARTPVEPDTLFRAASLSKPITAIVVLKLVELGRFGLDDRILPLLGERGPRVDRIRDLRVRDITIRHLLHHTGGWDRIKSGDQTILPRSAQLAAIAGVALPRCNDLVGPALEEALDFTPGERYAYSNLGYCILGAIVERAAGKPFPDLARELALEPSGARGIRSAHTLLRDRAPGETVYYDYPGAPVIDVLPSFTTGKVLRPYGLVLLEGREAVGGWVASTIDYARVMLALDGRRGSRLLAERSFGLLVERPATAGDEGRASWYGLGYLVRPVGAGFNLWHGGGLPGSQTYFARLANGTTWVAFFNSRARDAGAALGDIDRTINAAARDVTVWPTNDLFDTFR